MRALVIYESMFGNTRSLAEAVAAGVGTRLPVELHEVGAAPDDVPADVALVVLGGPTHAFSLSRPQSRQVARTQYPDVEIVSPGRGLREWLATASVPPGTPVAVFDSRATGGWVCGSASAGAARALRRRGLGTFVGRQDFLVEGTTGPLRPGERERARDWGELLGIDVTAAAGTPS